MCGALLGGCDPPHDMSKTLAATMPSAWWLRLTAFIRPSYGLTTRKSGKSSPGSSIKFRMYFSLEYCQKKT